MDGVAVLESLRSCGLRVLVLTSATEPSAAAQAMRPGAAGVLYKDIDPDALVRAIRSVTGRQRAARAGGPPARSSAAPGPTCSPPREREVLARIADGRSNREIARAAAVIREDGEGARELGAGQTRGAGPDPGGGVRGPSSGRGNGRLERALKPLVSPPRSPLCRAGPSTWQANRLHGGPDGDRGSVVAKTSGITRIPAGRRTKWWAPGSGWSWWRSRDRFPGSSLVRKKRRPGLAAAAGGVHAGAEPALPVRVAQRVPGRRGVRPAKRPDRRRQGERGRRRQTLRRAWQASSPDR